MTSPEPATPQAARRRDVHHGRRRRALAVPATLLALATLSAPSREPGQPAPPDTNTSVAAQQKTETPVGATSIRQKQAMTKPSTGSKQRPFMPSHKMPHPRPTVWPEIPYYESIPLREATFATKLKWAVALWLPPLAHDDLPLHLYAVAILDRRRAPLINDTLLFAVFVLHGRPAVAVRMADIDTIRHLAASVAAHGRPRLERVLFGTPFPIKGVPEPSTWNADLSRLRFGRYLVGSDPTPSFLELYERYVTSRSPTADP